MTHQEYKNRWLEHQWKELEKSAEFMAAFSSGDFPMADTIASKVLYGEARNKKEHHALQRRKRIKDEFY